jgi:hypothetical protein
MVTVNEEYSKRSNNNWSSKHYAACSFGWWLMAGAGLFREKSTADWLLVASLF